MRTFDVALTLLHEDFEGYRDATELLETWQLIDAAGIATLSLEFDPYSVGGQRQHPRLTINNTSGSTASVRLATVDTRGFGYWIHGNASAGASSTLLGRYRCSSGLAGSTVVVFAQNSIISSNATATVTADGEWHELTAAYSVFEDSVFAQGHRFELNAIPAGASGTIDFDDIRITRQEPIEHGINNTVPVASMRMDWADGYRETIIWPTHLTVARDGTEHRSLLRVVPQMRVEYTTVAGDPVMAAQIDAWLWANAGQQVAVPRWQDALRFDRIEQSNTWIWLTGGTTTDRWFWPEQRIMLWRGFDDYEAVQIWQVGSNWVRLDVNVNQVQGTWDSSTLVVPLIPGRISPTVALRRPSGRTGVIPLAFDLDLVMRTLP